MKIFVRGDRTVSVAVEPCQSVESLISTIEEATGQLWLSVSRSQRKKDPNSAHCTALLCAASNLQHHLTMLNA